MNRVVSQNHIFLFANLVDDLIDGKHTLGGEGSFATAAIQILKEATGANIFYTLAGRLGEDASGSFLKRTLEELHVDCSGVTMGGTITPQVFVEGTQKGKFVGSNGAPICCFHEEELQHFQPEWMKPGWIFFTSNTIKDDGTWEAIQKILAASPRLVFFDINWRENIFSTGRMGREKFIEKRLAPVLQRAEIVKGTADEIRQFCGVNAVWGQRLTFDITPSRSAVCFPLMEYLRALWLTAEKLTP